MRFIALLATMLVTSWFLTAAPALADHGSVNVSIDRIDSSAASNESIVTGSFRAVAKVTSPNDGAPVPGTLLTLTTLSEFGGQSGFIVLARTVTDADGFGVLDFEPRIAGEHELRVDYTLPGDTHSETTSVTMQFDPGDEQFYRSEGGIHIFGHEWIVIGVVSTIWFVLLLIALGIADIARAGMVVGAEKSGAEGIEESPA